MTKLPSNPTAASSAESNNTPHWKEALITQYRDKMQELDAETQAVNQELNDMGADPYSMDQFHPGADAAIRAFDTYEASQKTNNKLVQLQQINTQEVEQQFQTAFNTLTRANAEFCHQHGAQMTEEAEKAFADALQLLPANGTIEREFFTAICEEKIATEAHSENYQFMLSVLQNGIDKALGLSQ